MNKDKKTAARRRSVRRSTFVSFVLLMVSPGCASSGQQTPLEVLRESCEEELAHSLECSEQSDAEFEGLADEYCGYYEQAGAETNDACTLALAASLDCTSSLSCAAYVDDGTPREGCPETALAAANSCPELFGLCGGMSSVENVQSCSVEWSDCADNNTYQIDCDADTCTCEKNGERGAQFDSMQCDSITADPEPFVSTQCGWPALWPINDEF